MDTMSIGTRLMQGVLKRVLKKVIKSSLGVEADINFNDKLTLEYDEQGGVLVHLNADLFMEGSEFEKLLDRV